MPKGQSAVGLQDGEREGSFLTEGDDPTLNEAEAHGSTGGGTGSRAEESLIEDLPPELKEKEKELLRAFHAKTQKLAQDRRLLESKAKASEQKAQMWDKVATQPWFTSALKNERTRAANGGVNPEDLKVELSDEQFETVRGTKEGLVNFVRNLSMRIAKSMTAGPLQDNAQRSQQLADELNLLKAARRYPEIADLHEQGALDEYLSRGASYESAYKEYCFDNGVTPKGKGKTEGDLPEVEEPALEEDVREERERQERVSRSVGKVGAGRMERGRRVIQAASFDEAFAAALKSEFSGNRNYQVVRKKA